MNIWGSYGGYEGRLVICEIDSSLEPGQLASAEYLAEMVRFVLEKRGHMENTYKRALEVMLVGMIQGKKFSDSEIASRIEQCGWKTEDSYVMHPPGRRGAGGEIRDPRQPVSVIMWKPEFREARR